MPVIRRARTRANLRRRDRAADIALLLSGVTGWRRPRQTSVRVASRPRPVQALEVAPGGAPPTPNRSVLKAPQTDASPHKTASQELGQDVRTSTRRGRPIGRPRATTATAKRLPLVLRHVEVRELLGEP